MTTNQLTYYDPKASFAMDNVLLVVESNISMPLFIKVGPRVYTNPLLISSFTSPHA